MPPSPAQPMPLVPRCLKCRMRDSRNWAGCCHLCTSRWWRSRTCTARRRPLLPCCAESWTYTPHTLAWPVKAVVSKRNSRGMDTIQLVELKRRCKVAGGEPRRAQMGTLHGCSRQEGSAAPIQPSVRQRRRHPATRRTADFHLAPKQGRALPRALPLPSLNPEAGDWAEMICRTLKRQAVTAEAAQDACASIGGWNASV